MMIHKYSGQYGLVFRLLLGNTFIIIFKALFVIVFCNMTGTAKSLQGEWPGCISTQNEPQIMTHQYLNADSNEISFSDQKKFFRLTQPGIHQHERAQTRCTQPGLSQPVIDQPGLSQFEINRSGINRLFKKYDREDVPGCAVGVYHNGEMIYRNAFGMANLDYGIPLTDSSAFYMASISKQVTAAAAGILMARDQLDPDSPVEDYLNDWPDWAREVRVKHLFNHTSGLPDSYELMNITGISLNNVMDIDDYMSVIKSGESLTNPPETRYSYTNSGYTTLAKLVEVISGRDFSSFVDAEILKPLGMTSTFFLDDRYRLVPNRVISYTPVAGDDVVYQENDPDSNGITSEAKESFRIRYLSNYQGVGPGGLYSGLKDWRHWEAFWSGDKELPVNLQEEFQELKQIMTERRVINSDTLDYGMGLELETWQGVRMEGHPGNFMGFKTDVRRFPEYGLAVLTLCNRDDANPVDINRSIAKMLLQNPFNHYLAPYEGTYYNDELQVEYNLVVDEGSLKLQRRLPPNGVMTEDEKDVWSIASWEFVFQRDEEDRITGFLVSTGRAREVEFVRK